MCRFFLALLLLSGCSHQARIEKLEKDVRRLRAELSDLEADLALFESTPDGRWANPKAQPKEPGEKKERRAKK
jgi:hypothetical protein